MAKITSQNITISIKKLSKDDATDNPVFLDDETVKQLIEVIEQLVDNSNLVVEVE